MDEILELCPNCGARSRTTRYCEYCGARLERGGAEPGDGAEGAGVAPSDADLRARFRALLEHPETARHLAAPTAAPTGAPSSGRRSPFPLVVLGLVVLAVALALQGGAFADGPAPLVAGFALLLLASLALRGRRGIGAARTLPARVVGERTSVEQSRRADSITAHFVTLEFADGHRDEYRVAGRLAGLLERDDMGVARLQGKHLLEFGRVAV